MEPSLLVVSLVSAQGNRTRVPKRFTDLALVVEGFFCIFGRGLPFFFYSASLSFSYLRVHIILRSNCLLHSFRESFTHSNYYPRQRQRKRESSKISLPPLLYRFGQHRWKIVCFLFSISISQSYVWWPQWSPPFSPSCTVYLWEDHMTILLRWW